MRIFDEEKVLSLYHKYGVIKDVQIRTGYSYQRVRIILDKHNVEIKRNNEKFNRCISKVWDGRERRGF